jgi:predicted DsbA family dithiol-disulfide isomerase
MKIEIYSDIACPWCFIGERRFARALAAYPRAGEVEVVYRSYQLDPDAPAAAVPHLEYMRGRYGASVSGMLQQVTDAARGEGIEMDWDGALAVNTLTAHRLLYLAEAEYGAPTQRALAEKLFDAHFSRGGDVSDHELLADLAESVGMDRARVHDYLASGEGLEETRYELDQARRLGIRSVPTFIFEGQYAVQGAQPASVFLRALEEIAEKIEPAPAVGGAAESAAARAGTDAACADGSCAV